MIKLTGPEGRLQLAVEIKSKTGASAEWVTQLRRNLLAHSFMPPAPFFLLVLPDYSYLWTDASAVNALAGPAFRVSTSEILAPYLKSDLSLNGLSVYGLGLLTTSWLNDLVRTDPQRGSADAKPQWLLDSGLHGAISGDSVELEAAA